MSEANQDTTAYTATLAACQAWRRDVQSGKTAVVSETLAAAGTATMVVTFDGSGDAGQIEGVHAHNATWAETALPAARVKLADV